MLTFTPEHDELRSAVRKFLIDRSPSAEVRRLADSPTGSDPAVWATLCDQLGLPGLAVPEQYGGAGYGVVELSIVLEEAGYALLSGPFFASIALAAQALATCGSEAAKARWLPPLAAGDITATVALSEVDGAWRPADTTVVAQRADDGWQVRGTKTLVVDGHTAELLLVPARAGDEVGLFAVEAAATGLR